MISNIYLFVCFKYALYLHVCTIWCILGDASMENWRCRDRREVYRLYTTL